MRRNVFLAVILVMVLMLEGAFAVFTLADEEKKPTVFVHYGDSDVAGGDGWIAQMQLRLFTYGYFEGEKYTPGTVDAATGDAFQRYFNAMGMNFSQDALSPEVQWMILKGEMKKWPLEEAAPTATPSPTPFPVFREGDRDDAIREIQQRLSDAGYFAYVEESCDLGQLDEGTLKALEAYMNMWNYKFSGVVDENLYLTIVRGTALPSPRPTVTPVPTVFIGYLENADNRINEVQQRLEELGYLKNGGYTTGVYDDTLQYALYDFCSINNVTPDNGGINQTMYSAIFSENAVAKPKQSIRYGDSSVDIEQLQKSLFALNCYEGLSRSGNVCDMDMLEAVKRFAEANNIGFDGYEITASIQNDIVSEKATSWTAPEPEKKNWILDTSSVFGMSMPRYVLIVICVAIVAGLAVLMIHTFGKDKNTANSSAAKSDKGGRDRANVELRVMYRGNHLGTYRQNITTPIHLGRGFNVIPLDSGDLSISKNHCQLSFHDNTLFLRDFSRNGTRVNGMSVHNEETVVRNNAEIEIGEHIIRVTIL